MDVLDALVHPTRVEEFIVFSADADFTNLLLRLRAHDRRSVILPIGPASPAYSSASDYVIDETQFIEDAITRKPRILEPSMIRVGQ